MPAARRALTRWAKPRIKAMGEAPPGTAIALLEILGTQLIGRPAIIINPVCGDKDVQTVAKFLNPK